MLDSGARAVGCPVIPAGPGNTEQQLEMIGHLKPVGLYRHAGLPEDPARCGRRRRQGRLLDQEGGRGRRGLPAFAAGGDQEPRHRRLPDLCHRRSRPRRLRDAGAPGHGAERGRAAGDRPPRHRRSGGRGRSGRGRGYVVRSAPSLAPPRARRSFRGARRPLALRPQQYPHQGLDGPRRSDREGEGHVRAPGPDRRGRQTSSGAETAAPRHHPRGRAGRDDA